MTSPATKEMTHRKDPIYQWFSTYGYDPSEGLTAHSQGSHSSRDPACQVFMVQFLRVAKLQL